MLSFLILCMRSSLSFDFGSRIAVRILLPLTFRECEGVRGGRGACSSCFLDKLNMRVGFAAVIFDSGSGRELSVGEVGDVTGVNEAIVPPTPIRDVGGTIL